VQEKLNVAQAEAEAAAVAAGLELDDMMDDGLRGNGNGKQRSEDEVTRSRKTRIKGRPRRRKSTLTPDELERLLLL
jgi:hypothetical protein